MGPAIVSFLQQLAPAPDADLEVRFRYQSVLNRIDIERRIGQSIVTLSMHNAPARDVLKAIEEASGTPLAISPADLLDRAGPITLDVNEVPLLDVLRQLGEKHQWRLGVQPNSTTAILTAGPWTEARGLSTHAGPFLVVLNTAARSDSMVPVEGAKSSFSARLNVSIIREPKLRVQGPVQFAIDAAIDDNGRSILRSGPVNPFMNGGFGMGAGGLLSPVLTQTLPLAEPADRLVRLRGHIEADLIASMERWEIADIANLRSQTRKLDNETWAIRSLTKADQAYDMVVTMPQRMMMMWNWGTPTQAMPQLLDAQGRGWVGNLQDQSFDGNTMLTTIRYTPDNANRGMIFRNGVAVPAPGDNQKAGDPVKIVWELPRETVTQTFSFEFHDVALP